jgi:hypothetical protein
MEKFEVLYTVGGNVKWYNRYGSFLKAGQRFPAPPKIQTTI